MPSIGRNNRKVTKTEILMKNKALKISLPKVFSTSIVIARINIAESNFKYVEESESNPPGFPKKEAIAYLKLYVNSGKS